MSSGSELPTASTPLAESKSKETNDAESSEGHDSILEFSVKPASAGIPMKVFNKIKSRRGSRLSENGDVSHSNNCYSPFADIKELKQALMVRVY